MQRLALCRALVYEPDLLLLDEPFSNLDAKLREQMRIEVKLLQRRLGITVLFVTHDQIEALSLSDRIAVMQRGRVEQVGSAAQPLRAARLRVRPRLPRPDGDPARARRRRRRGRADQRATDASGGAQRAARRAQPRGPRRAGRHAHPGRRGPRRHPARGHRGGAGRPVPAGRQHADRRHRHAAVRRRPLRGARRASAASTASCCSCPGRATGARASACASASRPRW